MVFIGSHIGIARSRSLFIITLSWLSEKTHTKKQYIEVPAKKNNTLKPLYKNISLKI